MDCVAEERSYLDAVSMICMKPTLCPPLSLYAGGLPASSRKDGGRYQDSTDRRILHTAASGLDDVSMKSEGISFVVVLAKARTILKWDRARMQFRCIPGFWVNSDVVF